VAQLYDRIGSTYGRYRRPDPRIGAIVADAVGRGTVVSVGSGTGAYEPRRAGVVAVEPSGTMIRQRESGCAPVVQGVAEHLPFADASFDVALAVLTIHHWTDHIAGLRELARVAERQVIFTWDPEVFAPFWLVADYVPEIPKMEADVASLRHIVATLDVTEVKAIPVPWDCTDGFCGAYWRRPHVYLDPDARAAISGFARMDGATVDAAMQRLHRDLEDGTWHERNRALLGLEDIDLGYRLVVARGAR
jgi:SAM-dependent methyltransferase